MIVYLDSCSLQRPLDEQSIEADYFCTCDDKFLKKAKAIGHKYTQVVSPTGFILEVENES